MNKRIVIIGGGVVGLATAWELIKRGHQVQLLERNAEPGSATSFANGGQLSYRYVAPLADSGVPLQGMKWMGICVSGCLSSSGAGCCSFCAPVITRPIK